MAVEGVMKSEQFTNADIITPSVVVRKHQRHEGITPCPTASGAVRLIRLHDAYETERIEGETTSRGEPPTVPAFDDVDGNRVFIGGGRATSNPTFTEALRNRIWNVSFLYDYVLDAAEGLKSQLLGGKLYVDSLTVVSDDDDQLLVSVNIPSTCFDVGLLGKPMEETQ